MVEMKEVIGSVKLELTVDQADRMINVLLAHMENVRRVAVVANSPRVTEAVEKECLELQNIMECICDNLNK